MGNEDSYGRDNASIQEAVNRKTLFKNYWGLSMKCPEFKGAALSAIPKVHVVKNVNTNLRPDYNST